MKMGRSQRRLDPRGSGDAIRDLPAGRLLDWRRAPDARTADSEVCRAPFRPRRATPFNRGTVRQVLRLRPVGLSERGFTRPAVGKARPRAALLNRDFLEKLQAARRPKPLREWRATQDKNTNTYVIEIAL